MHTIQKFQNSWLCFFFLVNIENQTVIQSTHKVLKKNAKAAGQNIFLTHSRLNLIRKIITTNKITKPKPDLAITFLLKKETLSLKPKSFGLKIKATDPVIQKNAFIKQGQQTLAVQTRKIFLNKIYNQFPFGKKLQSSLFRHNLNNTKLSEGWNLFSEKISAAREPFEAKQSGFFFNTDVEGFVYKNNSIIKKTSNKYDMQLPQGKLLSSKDFNNKKATYSKMLEISLITISLASANRIRQWAEKTLPNGKLVGEVLNPETVHYKTLKPIKGGLFCERIFGPLKDHECACGKKFNIKHYLAKLTTSTSQPNGTAFLNLSQSAAETKHDDKVYKKRYFCRVCDVEYTYSIIRRTQLGYIKLASPTTHVWFVKGLPSYISILLDMKKTHLQNVIYNTETLTLEHALKYSNKNDMPLTPSSIFESWQKIMSFRKDSPEIYREKSNLNNSKIQLQIKNIDSKKIKKTVYLNPSKNTDPNKKFSTQNDNIKTESINPTFNLKLHKNEEFLPKRARSTRLSLVLKFCPQGLTYSINFTKLAKIKKSPQDLPKISVENSQENYNVLEFLKDNNKPKVEKAQSLFKSLHRPEAGFFYNLYKQNKKTFYSRKNNKIIENGSVANVILKSSCKEVRNNKIACVQDIKDNGNRFGTSKQACCNKIYSSVAFGLKIRDLQYLKSIFRKYSKLIKGQKDYFLINSKPQNKNDKASLFFNLLQEPVAHILFFQAQQQQALEIKKKVTRINFAPLTINRAWLAIFNSLIPYGELKMLKKTILITKHFFNKKSALAQFENIQSSNHFFFFKSNVSKHSAKKLKNLDIFLKNIACIVKANWKFKAIYVSLVPASKQEPSAFIKSNTTTKHPVRMNTIITTLLPMLSALTFQSNLVVILTKKNKNLLWNILKYSLEKLWLLSSCFLSFSNTTTITASLNSKKAFNIVCLLTSFLKVNNFNFFEKQTTKLSLMFLLNLTNEFNKSFATDFTPIKTQIPKKPQIVALSKIISKNKKKAVLRKKIQKIGKINENLKIKLTQRLNACFMYYLTQNLNKIKVISYYKKNAQKIKKNALFYYYAYQSDWSRQSKLFNKALYKKNKVTLFSLFDAKPQVELQLKKIQKTIKQNFISRPLSDSLDFTKGFYKEKNVKFKRCLKKTHLQSNREVENLKKGFYVNNLNRIYKKLRIVYNFSFVPTSVLKFFYCIVYKRVPLKKMAELKLFNAPLFLERLAKTQSVFLFKKKKSKYEQNFKAITETKNQALQIINYFSFLKTSKHLTHYFFFLNPSEKQRIYKLYNSLLLQFKTCCNKIYSFENAAACLWPIQNKILKYLFLLKAFFYNKNIINKKTVLSTTKETAFFQQPNLKQDLMQSEQINKNLEESLLSETTEPVLVNNLYCISHRELWEQEKNWQNFAYYYYDYSQNIFKGVDLVIKTYKHRNYDILFTPLIVSNPNGSIYENNSKIFKKLFNTGMNINTSFSGAGLIQKLLNEYDFNELKKIDKQNRIILFEYNKYLKNLKKKLASRVVPRKVKAGVSGKEVSPKAKSIIKKREQIFYKACHIRDVLIRRTKLTRKILIFFEYNTKFNTDTENTNYIENMILTLLPVLPPVLRPVLKMAGQFTISDLNRLYQRIIYRNERLKKFLKDPALNSSFEMKYAQRLLQEAVDNLIQNGKSGAVSEKDTRGRLLKSLSDILKGKQGRFRQYLLGKRVDYSGRSVIVVGPQLKLYECGIPKEMALVLYSPFLIKRILNEKLADTYLSAKKLIKTNPVLVSQLLREIMKSCPVLLNRAPTLHRLGFQAFQPKLIDGKAILLHPLVCPAFNADFDGDQMAVHVPITFEARAEAWKLMLARTNLLSPATGDPLILPSQDMVLGCYYLTTNYTGLQKKSHSFFLKISDAAYFNNITDVLKAYSQKLINIHTIIWVNINANIENGHILEQPLEIRVPLTRYKLSKHKKLLNTENPTEAVLKEVSKKEQTKVNEKHKQNNIVAVIKKAFDNLNYLEIYPKSHNIVNHTSLNNKYTQVGNFLKDDCQPLPDEFRVKQSIFECEHFFLRTRIKQIIRTTPGKILFNIMIKNAIEKQPNRLIN